MPTEKQVFKKLSEIIDPELGVNIVDLGLIYEVKLAKAEGIPEEPEETKEKTIANKTGKTKTSRVRAEIKMTLTSIGCPLAGFFAMQVEQKAKEVPGIGDAHVHVVWDPPWTMDKMSRNARDALGIA